MAERVSIIIPAYNSATHIRETITSCLAQTYDNTELIIIDDGSTDDTVSIVKSYGDAVRLIQQANQGPAIARNTGIDIATGQYIKFCDADDILYPHHLEKVMACFEQNPDVGAVYTDYLHVLADGNTPKPNINTIDLISGDIYCRLLTSHYNAILTSALTVKRAYLLEVGLFWHNPDIRHAEDWDLFLRLAARYPYATVPEILVKYRWHEDNISTQKLSASYGRLVAWERARADALQKKCFTNSEFDQMVAARYHSFAIEAWRWQKKPQARHALQQAIKLTPQSRLIRRLYWALTYIAPVQIVSSINTVLQRIRRT